MYRGTVASAIRGKRGQHLLRDLRDALDALPVKRLVRRSLTTDDGVCTLGSLKIAADFAAAYVTPEMDDYHLQDLNHPLAKVLDVATCMVQEIEYENDDGGPHNETPEQRWTRMRHWVDRRIKPTEGTPCDASC